MTSPYSSRLITVPATEATTIGAKALTEKCRSTTSIANSAPAIGALKLAETPAATAHPKRSRPVMPSALIRLLTQVEITPAICTTGPSPPGRAASGEGNEGGQRRGEPLLVLDAPVMQRRAFDHIGDRAHPPRPG